MSARSSAEVSGSGPLGDVRGRRDLLRFITCGSVDDGKSTLIGRLLYDSKQLPDDQLAALERDSRKSGTRDGALDLALALDGLAAEREQGITIDVAYRFFSTERRSFIVADTPGHEQYTRNMATGASTADAAVLLIDARKGLSVQTRRHSLIVSMLGIRHVVLAVNKMDLVEWSQERFDEIVAAYRAFAGDLGFRDVSAIPMAATLGDNVTRGSAETPWYRGPSLLAHLETLDVSADRAEGSFRLAVQWVNRPDADFRGFAGLVSGAPVRVGQRVVVQPSGQITAVARIVTFDGDLDVAGPGQSVTLTLADEVDVSRGSVISGADAPAQVSMVLDVRIFWMAKTPLRQGDGFLAKLGTQTVPVTVSRIVARTDLGTLVAAPASALRENDVGEVGLLFDRLVVVDPYLADRETGSLVLIDRETFDTLGMGLVLDGVSGMSEVEGRSRSDGADPAWSPEIQRWLPAPFTARWRSALKAATWRVAGTLLTFAAAYALTADLRVALLLGAFEIVVKLALYFGHERLWARLGLGLRASPHDFSSRHPLHSPES